MKIITALLTIVLIAASCDKDDTHICPEIKNIDLLKGAANNTVTITGKNFGTSGTAIIVKFNGVAATEFIRVVDTLISVIVPQNVSTGKITVSNNQCTATSVMDFVVLPGSWTRKADMPSSSGRAEGLGFAIGNKGYCFGGWDTGNSFGELFEYDQSTGGWIKKSSCPIAFRNGFALVINGKAYLGMGLYSNSNPNPNSRQVWEYDPTSNIWTRKADFPGPDHQSIIGFGVGNKGYVGLGHLPPSSIPQNTRDWWEYDPAANQWTQKPNMPSATANFVYPGGFIINNKIYVGLASYMYVGSNEFWEYDPATSVWTRKSDFPGNISFQSAGFAIDGMGYAAGGYYFPSFWRYNPVNDSWTELGFFSTRQAGAAFAIGNKGYFVGGAGSGTFTENWIKKDLWEFDPAR